MQFVLRTLFFFPPGLSHHVWSLTSELTILLSPWVIPSCVVAYIRAYHSSFPLGYPVMCGRLHQSLPFFFPPGLSRHVWSLTSELTILLSPWVIPSCVVAYIRAYHSSFPLGYPVMCGRLHQSLPFFFPPGLSRHVWSLTSELTILLSPWVIPSCVVAHIRAYHSSFPLGYPVMCGRSHQSLPFFFPPGLSRHVWSLTSELTILLSPWVIPSCVVAYIRAYHSSFPLGYPVMCGRLHQSLPFFFPPGLSLHVWSLTSELTILLSPWVIPSCVVAHIRAYHSSFPLGYPVMCGRSHQSLPFFFPPGLSRLVWSLTSELTILLSPWVIPSCVVAYIRAYHSSFPLGYPVMCGRSHQRLPFFFPPGLSRHVWSLTSELTILLSPWVIPSCVVAYIRAYHSSFPLGYPFMCGRSHQSLPFFFPPGLSLHVWSLTSELTILLSPWVIPSCVVAHIRAYHSSFPLGYPVLCGRLHQSLPFFFPPGLSRHVWSLTSELTILLSPWVIPSCVVAYIRAYHSSFPLGYPIMCGRLHQSLPFFFPPGLSHHVWRLQLIPHSNIT